MTISPTSRYFGLETRILERPDGTKVAYLARRLVPPPERFATLGFHTVVQGERPDHVAAKHLGDPEQFWRLADANAVLRPNELTARVGSLVRVTLPEGIPGVADA
ncbi:hypothetical protein [Sabulicella glaciei]|uniref:LysM domain-containing protein n=1 Tax=Sabulicella glaciei TaxID=2984948 RepID=A0ABT3NQ29_9PROT|nr:hypothetical protein [Roseococcus sp. MDT2-1-1]MCW8084274.1 hypothetical protein [Roseococcus sp. MDT2-1-1]